MDHQSELKGIIDRFLFQNNENGYAVLAVQIDTQTTIIARGYLPNIHAGQEIVLQGSWTVHPKFGKQFEAKQCIAQIPASTVGLKKYLGSGLIKGIGPAYAEKLVGYFGEIVLDVIDKHPERLREVPGIGRKRIEQITKAWQDQKEISTVMVYLQDKGISPAYAAKIYKAYGQNSIAVLTENPYRLADDIWGVGFKMADQIAQSIGIPRDSLKRIKSGLLFAISNHVGQGHLYIELQELKDKALELLGLENDDEPPRSNGSTGSPRAATQTNPPLVLSLSKDTSEKLLKNAFHDLYNEEKIKLISTNNLHYITLTQYYFAEKGTAQKLQKLLQNPILHAIDSNEIYQKLRAPQNDNEVMLNEDQQRGILACLQNKVTIITGGPGTGKTTLIKRLLGFLDDHKLSYKLAAPTGRAAKRITENTGRFALTIHRLLEFDVTTRGFTRTEQNALQLDFLIIDEASMIDIFLAHAVLKAMPFSGHLILIGDVDQLPSVGAGNFLNDLIASNTVATIRLNQIFRQAQDSLIIVNAHRINQGEFPVSSLPDAKKDFVFIKEDDPLMVQKHLDELLLKRIPRIGMSAADTMVLVPMNRGVVGTQNLNIHLQKLLNKNPLRDAPNGAPQGDRSYPVRAEPVEAYEQNSNQPHTTTKRLQHGIYTFMIGDRVMQIRNNYDKAVFNGDTGIIEDINISDKIIHTRFYDRAIEYEYTELDELVLAYAISIHKSQGSEYPAVIIPIFMQHFTLLQRNLIYTALTRAKKLCIIIGQTKALAMAIKNNKSLARTTFLTQFLTSDLQCR